MLHSLKVRRWGLVWFGLVTVLAAVAAGQSAEELEAAGLDEPPAPEVSRAPVGPPRGPAAMSVTVVAQDGDSPSGVPGAVSSLSSPFTNSLGQVGFSGNASENFIWIDTGVAWSNDDAMSNTLSGAESTIGIGDMGQFIYSPSVDGSDSVWTQDGLLETEDTQAPDFPAGTNSTFHSRPTMLPDGTAHWIAGFNDGAGGTSTVGRMVYRSVGGTTTVVLRSDDLVGGLAIDRPSGVGFDYDFSDDGSHHIHELLLDTGGTTDDGIVYVDGAIVARETEATGDGDNWDNFDAMSINNAGNYLFSGDSDGATTSDEFLAYNASIALREGDVVDGVTLGTTVSALSINNLGQAAFIWNDDGGDEQLFVAPDAADLSGTAVLLLAVGDAVDTTGDMVADATVTDFNASAQIAPGLDLATDNVVYVEVDLDFGSGDVEAVIAIDATGQIPVELQSFAIE